MPQTTRTQLYLPDPVRQQLMRLAERRGQSMAEVVRQFIDQGLEREQTANSSGKQAIRNLIQIRATGGPTDLSTNLDHYLYGKVYKRNGLAPLEEHLDDI